MTATLTTIRTEVKDAIITTGVRATEFFNETLTPPVAVVIPGDPYVTPGDTFGGHLMNIEVLLVGGKGTNKSTANGLDEMIESVIEVLGDWDVANVAQPGLVTINGAQFLGTVLTLTTAIQF